MDNQIIKMVFDDMGGEAISFTIVTDKEVKIITFHESNDEDDNVMGNIKSQSVMDSYVMGNNDNDDIFERIEHAKTHAISYEEVSQKGFEYSVKELSAKQLKYILS